MSHAIHELYEKHVYPAMSHPVADPAVSAVAARMGGLEVPHPCHARILEIGCGSGHHLLPLALRWPESHFVGIDLAARPIAEARQRAAAAGVNNICFLAGDLRDFEPTEGPFDFIIAHGFFSWVPDEVKAALLIFCGRHLSPRGIATISFNLECGWAARLPVIAKACAIQQARGGDVVSALEILRLLTGHDEPAAAIIADMLAKGPAILACDDFAPINDPWPLDRFVQAAANTGLRWLGESDPAENIPSCLGVESLAALRAGTDDPLEFQMAVDAAVGRTFRSGLVCRADAPVAGQIPLSGVLEFSVRAGHEPTDPAVREIFDVVRSFAPACVPMKVIMAALPPCEVKLVARQISEGISGGWLRPRIEPVSFASEPPDFPRLDAFRLFCAHEGLPLVDVWHMPCSFPQAHYPLLAAMDGSRSREDLARFSKNHCPELAFEPWLRHLAGRGMFS
jgi:SAM-dependent methyltransferase